MNQKQQKALRQIQRILKDHFSHSMVSVIFRDELADRLAIAVVDGTASVPQALDLAQRALNQIEIEHFGFVKTVFEVPRDIKEN